RCILSAVTASDRARYDADLRDLDIIVSQLRLTAGTVGAVFIYETENGDFKVSLRSNDPKLDVAAVAAAFGGGGHAAAAGYTTKPPLAAARMQAVEAMQSAFGRMDRSL
ncbi:MAG: DHHA1 domain-containing protein, partial [Lachnospiraceae bacterium]|nr:DHHA1 domain-containing protein [Lachnospiraceae bacterium]